MEIRTWRAPVVPPDVDVETLVFRIIFIHLRCAARGQVPFADMPGLVATIPQGLGQGRFRVVKPHGRTESSW